MLRWDWGGKAAFLPPLQRMGLGTWQVGASHLPSQAANINFSLKNSTRHLVALIESAVKEWMKCNQCRKMLLSLQGTGSRCLGGRTGCSVLLSTVQGSCWTTNHWSLGGFPGQGLLCACPVHFHAQQLLAAVEVGIPGNLWHGCDWILKVLLCVKFFVWRREEILLFTVTGTLCSRWQPELFFLPSHPLSPSEQP